MLKKFSSIFSKSDIDENEISNQLKAILKSEKFSLFNKKGKLFIVIDTADYSKDELRSIKVLEKKIIKVIKRKNVNIIFSGNSSGDKVNVDNDVNSSIGKNNENTTKKEVKGVKKIIAVCSGKGGVGKSTFAVNLALSLKRIGRKVALVDADIYGPSIYHMMGLESFIKNDNNKDILKPIDSYGVRCMSIGSFIEEGKAAIWRGPMAVKALFRIIYGVKWINDDEDDIDYMLIDFPPGTGDIHLSLLQNVPINVAVFVTTPQIVASLDVERSIEMFQKLGINIAGIVENMSYFYDEKNQEKNYIFGCGFTAKLAEKMNIDYLGEIPLDKRISLSGDSKKPFVKNFVSDPIAISFGLIADKVIEF